ncbi:MAG TPA: acylphosphatase [Syntrophorhabdaceae bacterium]|nr:acylphosphatase [Syntrophorhabdaceae bacterium]HOL05095.1 acylphosphatase [Syntrophorhabdaceae bacterium]HON84587.1 acylphosphatase [Syntrophorhabdaceae bacterium]HPC66207.1 acylphosphatase [Syntrophorhabdaceae bacterium]HPP41580.1 acylphosphatase [Syntrophorhabdaceae bacterium]
MKRVHIFVSGIVQGVFFRHFTSMKAKQLGLTGWVRNLRDGRVEMVCEGNEDAIKEMIAWSKKGPQGAFVEKTDVRYEEYQGEFTDFQITR